MSYIIKASETHPMKGAEFELFQIRLGPARKWVRDDKKGKRWGFKHPDSGEVVHIWNAGVGPVPKVGQISKAFTVIEVPQKWTSEDLTSAVLNAGIEKSQMDLSSKAPELGKPELSVNEEE